MITIGNILKFSSLVLGKVNANGLKDLNVLLRVAMVINPWGGGQPEWHIAGCAGEEI